MHLVVVDRPLRSSPVLVLCAVLAWVAISTLAAGEEGNEAVVRLTLPGKPWSLLLDLPGFELGRPRMRNEGNRVELAGHAEETGLVVAIRLERARHEGNARAYRKSLWKELKRETPFDLRGLRQSERGEMALLEYRLPVFRGLEVKQMNLHALIVRDGVWIDVHLSKSPYVEDEDAPLFEAVLGSIRFGE